MQAVKTALSGPGCKPVMTSPSTTPCATAASRLPTPKIRSHRRLLPAAWRNSIEAPRMIRLAISSMMGMYSPSSKVA
ncbi:hypothetical protein D3C71_1810380 [compost metagenome]